MTTCRDKGGGRGEKRGGGGYDLAHQDPRTRRSLKQGKREQPPDPSGTELKRTVTDRIGERRTGALMVDSGRYGEARIPRPPMVVVVIVVIVVVVLVLLVVVVLFPLNR